jgi:hypothetical protein
VQLSRGMFIKVRKAGEDDEWVTGMVGLAHGTSVALILNGAVRCGDGFLSGFLPLTHANDQFTGLLHGDRYEVELIPRT